MIVVPPPPALSDLRAGTRLVAGLGVSTVLPDLDFETYSEAGYVWTGEKWIGPPRAPQGKKGLKVVGAARYAEHPSTEVLSLAYDLKDGRGKRHWKPGDALPLDLFDHIAAGGLLEAWNVGFERHIWEKVCVPRLGWAAVPRGQWRCAMAKARAFALPPSLDMAGTVLSTGARKDAAGARLLKRFSMPRNPTKNDLRLRIDPATDPDGPALYAYNLADIAAEAEISSRTPDLTTDELEWWQIDQEINSRGVQMDMDGVQNCIAVVEQAFERYNGELLALTAGAVGAASEIQKMLGWLGAQGVHLDSLQEETVEEVLKHPLPVAARRALEIRALIGSASVKKLFAMDNTVCANGRICDLYAYHGARTGRVTGSAVQPTNLPGYGPTVCLCDCGRHYAAARSLCPWCGLTGGVPKPWSWRAARDALEVIACRSLEMVEYMFGDALTTIAGCLRALFVSAPGHDLICSDYSAIEAVVLAELAGEAWRQDVFRTHGKIYEASAANASGTPLEAILDHKRVTGEHHPLRKTIGKVRELAGGFGGGLNAWKNFGADEFMSDEEIQRDVWKWREESPTIVEFWGGQSRGRGWNRRPELFGVEGAFIAAVRNPGQTYEFRGHTFLMRGDVLYLGLLSGRHLTYHRPRLGKGKWRADEAEISYEGYNTNPKNGPVGWIRMTTFGGRLTENIVQATARDLKRDGLVRQWRAGYRAVMHTYDENCAEVPEGWGSVEEFEALMTAGSSWAPGWPVRAAGGWRGKRYRKD